MMKKQLYLEKAFPDSSLCKQLLLQAAAGCRAAPSPGLQSAAGCSLLWSCRCWDTFVQPCFGGSRDSERSLTNSSA